MEGAGGNWQVREFTVGAGHTIATGQFENIRLYAEIKATIKVGYTEEEFKEALNEVETKLRMILKETFIAQKLKRTEPKSPDDVRTIQRNVETA
jgi:hypothetical protein